MHICPPSMHALANQHVRPLHPSPIDCLPPGLQSTILPPTLSPWPPPLPPALPQVVEQTKQVQIDTLKEMDRQAGAIAAVDERFGEVGGQTGWHMRWVVRLAGRQADGVCGGGEAGRQAGSWAMQGQAGTQRRKEHLLCGCSCVNNHRGQPGRLPARLLHIDWHIDWPAGARQPPRT